MSVHPTASVHVSAVVEDGATIGAGAVIGPFCVIGADVWLGAGVVLKSHVVLAGDTSIGDETIIFPFAVIGEIPQDLKFGGEKTKLIIGARNRIRETVTMNPGTAGGGGETRVGDDCLFMAGAHVGHDAVVGNHVIMANQSALAGHCVVGDNAIIGGLCGVHQFVRIGQGAIIGAVTMVTNDVIPYGLVTGQRGTLDGLNLIGMKRRGVARADITAVRSAYKILFDGNGAMQAKAQELSELPDGKNGMVGEILDFILGPSDRSFLSPSN
jgi:UDP-N-acetylglucosamine acyltransferase